MPPHKRLGFSRFSSLKSQFFQPGPIERLEDRWNPSGIWGPMASETVPPASGIQIPQEIAIVDESLLAQLPQKELQGSQVFLIHSHSDPIAQLDTVLAGLSDISVLRIIGHGEAGALWLGGQRINAQSLSDRSAEIKSWNRALTNDADLLLYGCSVAAGPAGLNFVQNLAKLTGADVAASTNITGNGGDVVLENSTGPIEHGLKTKIRDWAVAGLSLAFANLNSATFYAEQGNTFSLMTDHQETTQFRLVSGTLPAGISFDPAAGNLYGFPEKDTVGTYQLTFSAYDGTTTTEQPFTIKILKRHENSPLNYNTYNYTNPLVVNFYAFAALNGDGSIASWGDGRYGGTGAPSGHDFTQVVAGPSAFAALRTDGSIAAWGDSTYGGAGYPADRGYQRIMPLGGAFVAFKENGDAVIWGQTPFFDGVPNKIQGIVDIVTNSMAIAVLKNDGSIMAWGDPSRGAAGFPTTHDFSRIFSVEGGFIGLKKDGSVIQWGQQYSDFIPAPTDAGYVNIESNGYAYVGLKANGQMTAWGLEDSGGIGAPTQTQIVKVYPITNGFLALDRNGAIYVWGRTAQPPSIAPEENQGFVSIQYGNGSYSALRKDGSIFSWGDWVASGTSAPSAKGFSKVVQNNYAFLALRSDGTIASWGNRWLLERMPTANHRFVDIFATDLGFTAIDGDGYLTSWGEHTQYAPKDGGYQRVFTASSITAAMKADGTIASWGDSFYLGSPPTRKGFVVFASPLEQAPYFPVSALSKISVVQNAEANYQIPAQSIPTATFSMASGKLPEGLKFDAQTGTISGRATAKPGTYAVKILLDNGYGKATKDISITVLSSLPEVRDEISLRVGEFSVTALLATAPSLDVTLIPLEGFLLENSGLQFESSTGALTGTPRVGSGGNYHLKVMFPGLITKAPAASIDLTINEAPEFTFVSRAEFFIDERNTFTLMSVGYPKSGIQWQDGSAPPGIQFDPSTGVLSGNPQPGSEGSYALTFTIENELHERTSKTLALIVKEKIQPKTKASNQYFAALASDGTLFSWPSTSVNYPAGEGFVEIASNGSAFAALKSDGSIKAWGDASYGGTGAPMDKGYIKIFSNGRAFAALKKDGHISSWGNGVEPTSGPFEFVAAPVDGGYVDIVSNEFAFAAIKADGTIATWGDTLAGGAHGPTSTGFKKIAAGNGRFVALRDNGTLFGWGLGPVDATPIPTDGGYIQVFANALGFAALKADGSISSWGNSPLDGSVKAPKDKGFTTIVCSDYGFSALKSDGTISSWGAILHDGKDVPTSAGFVSVIANGDSFAALKLDGSVASWGFLPLSASAPPTGSGFVRVIGNGTAFAALRSDGSIEAWGAFLTGGRNAPEGTGYLAIVPNASGFAALNADGSISSWGDLDTQNLPRGTGFKEIIANQYAFVALKQDGTIQAWGKIAWGGYLVPPARKFVSFATPAEQLPWVSTTKTPNIAAQLHQSYSNLVPIRGYPYATISVSKGALPPGIQFDQRTGLLSGTPTKIGNYSFTLTAHHDLKTVKLDFQFKVVAPFNDPPTGLDKTLVSVEDQIVVFKELDFGFADPTDSPANALLAVNIVTLPAKGTLSLGGKAIVVNQEVPAAAIRAGKLTYLPPKNAAGDSFAKFTFRNRDNGGRQGAGNDLALSANTISLQIASVSDAPSGKNKTIPIDEDSTYSLNISDFGFTDAFDSPANQFSSVLITSLPSKGTLTLFGFFVFLNQEIPVALVKQGGLVFTPAAQRSGAGYDSISFKVRDSGDTSNGGVNLDPTPRKLTWNVASINDAPIGADKSISLYEDRVYKFAAADFKLVDPNDSPSNLLSTIQIASLPQRGALSLAGKAVKVGQEIFVQDLNAGKFAYTPPVDTSGNDLSSFAFKVRDNGGTARGGVNLAVDANRITFNLTAVNDAPTGVNQRLTVSKTAPLIFTLDQFILVDSKDLPSNALSRVQFTILPAKGKGTLSLNGTTLKANAFVNVADIVAGKLKYTLPSTAKGKGFATISFKVEDAGGTANGGKNLALSANVLTIDVA